MRVFALSRTPGSLQQVQDDDMKKLFSISGVFAALAAAPAWAQEGLEVIGRPVDGAMGFQPAATEVARRLQWLDGLILVIITAITLFVTALLAWVIFRYNRKRNPEAASFTHHTPIEIAWTVIPIVILVFIGAFSLPTPMNPNHTSADLDLGDMRILPDHFSTKHLDVELRAAFGIRGPDNVFDCFYVHDGGLAIRLNCPALYGLLRMRGR